MFTWCEWHVNKTEVKKSDLQIGGMRDVVWIIFEKDLQVEGGNLFSKVDIDLKIV